MAIRIDDEMAAEFGLKEGDKISIVVESKWIRFDENECLRQLALTSRHTRIEAEDVIVAMDEQQNLSFVVSASSQSPYLYRKSQAPGMVDRVYAEGNRVTGYLLTEFAMLTRARMAVLEIGEWLTAADIARLASNSPHNPSGSPDLWKKQGRIFSINHDGIDYYPGYGLDQAADFRPVKDLSTIIEIFDGCKHGWGMAFWFCANNSYLGGKRPQDLLASAPERVIEVVADEVRGFDHV